MTFVNERAVKAVRKARRCDACGVIIETGESAVQWAGVVDGDFATATYHSDCRKAEIALNSLHGTWGSDEWMGLGRDIEWDDWPWLIAEHPAVAARMKITIERFEEIERDQIACRAAFLKGHTK